MEKMKMQTPDIVQSNVQKLAELFPNCITEAADEHGNTKQAVNFEALKQILSSDLVEGNEAYEFTWAGKRACIAEANKSIKKTLRPCKDESVNWDTTQNIYVEGDNLEALKLLQESYLGAIKMIYIDPPYNTGSDLIYRDAYSASSEKYAAELGQYDDEGNRLFKNTQTNGKYHSDWCSMIYPRLMLARNLLSDDGAIFISIDDNEQDNLKKICNEIFGESNFICQFIWNTKKAAQGMTTEHMIVPNHEYILVYAKKAEGFKFVGLERDENNGFSNPDNDPRGLWKRQYLQRIGQGLPVRTIVDPSNGNSFSFETPYTQEKLDLWITEGRIIFPEDTSKYPARKEFLNEYANKQQLVTDLGLYATKSTTEKLYGIFDDAKIFTNPKPDTLIRFLVSQVQGKNFTVLDFFSGSATTAHAVMQLNAEDGGSRKFIMVQLPEACDTESEAYKAGYKNICEIGKERIRRAGKSLQKTADSGFTAKDDLGENTTANTSHLIEEGGDNVTANTSLPLGEGVGGSRRMRENLDIGFRVFKVDDSNMNDVYYSAGEYTQDLLESLESNIKPNRTDLDLLFGCLIDWGLPLSKPYTSEEMEGCTIHTYNNGDLIACFNENIPKSVIVEIAKRKPARAVFRDSGFEDSPAKINVFEIFKLYMPESAAEIEKRVKVI